ncbi:MAG: UvrD-helicase domain-containing protein [Chloroflexota bacterium]|nr:UvrD-helicase domain-containing protein [Chloroflexota bacterium]
MLHPQLGICVLEVKDWVEIVEASPETYIIRTRRGEERSESNPLDEARKKAQAIAKKLEHPELLHQRGKHRGKSVVPWAYGVVFPNLTRMLMYELGEVVHERYVLCSDDLKTGRLEQCIKQFEWRYAVDLTALQVDRVRSLLYPELKVKELGSSQSCAVLDLEQEQTAKEGLYETGAVDPFDITLTPEGQRVALDPIVRLVRGVAGSGKTLVLTTRAKYLSDIHASWRILVLTFNKPLSWNLETRLEDVGERIRVVNFHALCAEWLQDKGMWRTPVADSDQQNRIRMILTKKMPECTLDAEFLSEEFNWMKDTLTTTSEQYLKASRVGRGKRLSKRDRAIVMEVYNHYQHHLQNLRQFTWADIPQLVLTAIDEGMIPENQFEAILVDEAQDFAPSWFQVLTRVLNPQTRVMFMAADATQRIYRKFTWKALGFDVMGRSRMLSKSYRCTYEILCTAYELIRNNKLLISELQEEHEELLQPELSPVWMRHGSYPTLRCTPDIPDEMNFIVREIKQLLAIGFQPKDIAVLHRDPYGPSRYLNALKNHGLPALPLRDERAFSEQAIAVGTIHLAKGLEFRAVFLTELQRLFVTDRGFSATDKAKFDTEQLRLLYVGMTRARERLYLTYQRKLPKEIRHLQTFLHDSRSVPDQANEQVTVLR